MTSTRTTTTTAAQAMVTWCGAREVDGAQIDRFYEEYPQYKDVVKAAGRLRLFVALHGDVLASRMEGKVLYIRKAEVASADFIADLTSMLKTTRLSGGNSLAALEDSLQPLKDGESMRQFALKVKEIGLCLKDGQTYGSTLPQMLKQRVCGRYPLRVSKADAKQYPLVKKCLIVCH